jgi:uncharacterized protein
MWPTTRLISTNTSVNQTKLSSMSLKAQITEHMKDAMRAKDTARLGAIRLLLAAIKQREVDERIEMTDADVIGVIEKMLKQRRDSITAFEGAGRTDLADIEKYEVSVLQTYMPKQMSDAEISAIIDQVIADSGAQGAKDMGKVVGLVKPLVAGMADMGKVSGLIKARLS